MTGKDYLQLFYALIIGVLQGITEWLPVSSTGHMIVAFELLEVDVDKEFMDFFLVVVQFFSMLAVVTLYFKEINPFVKDSLKRKKVLSLWGKITFSVLPAAIVGFVLGDFIEEKLFNVVVVAVALIFYGVVFLLSERYAKKENGFGLNGLNFKKSLYIGLFQTLALVPGTSRSGATILGAGACGLDEESAAKYSFLLALPTMAGATVLKLIKGGLHFSPFNYAFVLTGGITAFGVSLLAIKFLMKVVKRYGFAPFGYYRILFGLFLLLYFLK